MSRFIKQLINRVCLLIVALGCIWAVPSHAQKEEPALFVQPSQVLFDKLGDRPSAVALGDVNGDSVLDIVTASRGSGFGDVIVLVGNGNGGFAESAGSPLTVGLSPSSIVLGDLNADSVLDMVTSNADSDDITVLMGDGNGTFAEVAGSPFKVGDFVVSVSLGDINGDLALDVVAANRGSNDVTVLVGNGNGGFGEATGSPFTVGNSPTSVALGDVNNDDVLDIVAANSRSDDATVLAGDRDGGFSAVPGSPFSVGNSPQSVALDDVDGDGALDIVTANLAFGDVTVLSGDGDGAFMEVPGSPLGAGRGSDTVALVDIDDDGALDIVVGNGSDVTVLSGDGSGGFMEVANSPFPVGDGPSVAIGDIDSDGALDLVSANFGSSDITLLSGDGSGNFMESTSNPIIFSNGLTDLDIGDIDGDGILDVAITREFRDEVLLLRGQGDAEFVHMSAPISVGDRPEAVALGDINNDGALDIVTVNNHPDDVTVLAGDGGGGFEAVTGSPFETVSPSSQNSVALADINQDNALDIVILGSGDITVLAGDGGGGFMEIAGSPFPASFSAQSIILGDVNGDDALDMVMANQLDNNVTVLAGDGSGGFIEFVDSPFSVDDDPKAVALNDVNGDGVLDIATANQSFNNVDVLIGDGTGGFASAEGSPFSAAIRSSPQSIALVDINGDSAPDIITAGGRNVVTALAGDGTGGFSASSGSPFFVPDPSQSLVVGLLDGDDLPDVLVIGNGFSTGTETLTALTTVPMVDLAIDKTSGTFFTPPGGTLTYTILVDNLGPADVVGARVQDMTPARLGDLSWTCTAQGDATCDASGTGAIDELVDLPTGDSVTFILEATLQEMDEVPVTNTASVTAPDDANEENTDNNADGDTDLVALFADDFERIEPD